jgi:IS30 family transposase
MKMRTAYGTIPLLRQYLRKGADLSTVEQAEVRFAADEINGRPRVAPTMDSGSRGGVA